jgi:hypothetical protein
MTPVDEEEPAKEPGWTHTYIYKHAPHTAYHHKLLHDMLQDYYANLNTGIQYYCTEYTHPTEATYWKTELTVTIWKDDKNGRVLNTVDGHTSKCAEALDSMEDATREAYEYYHGLRYEAMEADRFRYLPRYDLQKKDWVVTDPQHSSPALDTIVRYALALKVGNEDLQKELRGVYKAAGRYQKEIDKLRAQLG